jgi:hypothetical protein
MQLLEAGAHERASAPAATATAEGRSPSGGDRDLERRVAVLEARVARLVEALGDLVDMGDVGELDDAGGGDVPAGGR